MNDLIKNEKSDRGLTPKQEAFVEYLFGEANFDPVRAKVMAGYHKNVSTAEIMKNVGPIIEAELDAQLMMGGVQGVGALLDVLRDPTKPGNRERISAANSLLDRIGKTKEAAAQVNVKVDVSPVVYLPDKKQLEMTKEDYVEVNRRKEPEPVKEDSELLILDDEVVDLESEYIDYDNVETQ